MTADYVRSVVLRVNGSGAGNGSINPIASLLDVTESNNDGPGGTAVVGTMSGGGPLGPCSTDGQPILLKAFMSSMLAMKHLVSTDAASLWAFIAISVISLVLATAAS